MLRAAGIVALVVLAACGQSTPGAVHSPTPVVAEGNWNQNLSFTGDLTGQMKGIVPDNGDQTSTCTGTRTHIGETWADSFYGVMDASGKVWGLVFIINNFRGPGTYSDASVKVEMHSADLVQVWGVPGDKVTFTIDRGQQSGTVNAKMTNANTGKATLKLTGQWNCRT